MGKTITTKKPQIKYLLSPKRLLFLTIASFVFTTFYLVRTTPLVQAATGINRTINFQGKVVNSNGTNVADGQYTFVFKIYDAPSGGSNPWTETQSNVTVTGGVFRVSLGSVTPISGVDFNTDNIYLGINFNSDGEMTPRIRFASVPYALNAETVGGLTVTNTTGTLTIPNSTTVQFGGAFTTSAQDLTLTLSGSTNVTLPTTGTLATLGGVEALSNKSFSTTVTFSGVTTDLTTGVNESLMLAPNGTGNVLISSGAGGQAALIIDKTGSGDIFTASSAGITKFIINSDGTASTSGGLTVNGSGSIQSTNNQTLTIGGGSTGDLIIGRTSQTLQLPGLDCSSYGNGGKLTTTSGGILACDDEEISYSGSDIVFASANLGNVTLANTATFLNTVSITPTTNTGDVVVRANLWTRSLSATDQTITVQIRDASGGTCAGNLLTSATATLVSASGVNGPAVFASYLEVNPGTGVANDYSVCALSSTNSGAAAGGLVTAEVIDGGSVMGSVDWSISSLGTISPTNQTLDFLVGSNATASAKFGILNINSGTPTASVSSGLSGVGLSFDANGNIQTTSKQTLTIGGNTTGDIQFLGNNKLSLYLRNGDVGIGTGNINPLATFDVRPNYTNGGGTQPVASISGRTSNAALVVDNIGNGDIFTASSSSNTQFVVRQNGSVGIGNAARIPTAQLDVAGAASISGFLTFRIGDGSIQTSANSTLTVGGGSTGDLVIGRASQSLILPGFDCSGYGNDGKLTTTAGGVLICDNDGGASGAAGTWDVNSTLGIHYPGNNSTDLLVGGTSTQSATFSILGVAAGTNPTASISALQGANATKGLYMVGDGSLQSTRMNTLTIGGNTTGDIQFRPGNSSNSLYLASTGAVGFNGSFGSSGQCLITSGATSSPGWGGCTSGSNGNWWTLQGSQGTLFPINTTLDLLWGGTTSSSASFRVSGATQNRGTVSAASVSANTSFAGFVVDNRGSGDLLTASSSGLSRFTIFQNGNVTIGSTTNQGYKLDVQGSVRIGNNTTTNDISKQTTADWTVSGSSITTNDSVNTVTTSGNVLKLVTDLIGAGASLAAPAAGGTTGVNVTTGSVALQRPDKKFVVFVGGAATSRLYDPATNAWSAGPSTAGGVSLGAGSKAFQRQNGSFLISHGGATTTTLYQPGASADFGTAIAGPANTGTVGVGSQIIRRVDGKVLIIHGNTSTTSSVHDPVRATGTTSLIGTTIVGPATTGNVTTGSFAFQAQNGKWIVGLGGSTTTNIYDPSSPGAGGGGAFVAGPSLTTGTPGSGTHVIQLPDNRYLVLIGGSGNTQIYDSVSNSFSAGPALDTDTLGAGAHSFQRSDGKWVTVVGGNSQNLQLYDPTSGTNGSFSQLTGASGLVGATNAGVGALTLHRPDGKYVVVMGQTTQLTTVYDAGWNTTGTWTSEDINNTKISTYSAMLWSANPQSANNNARLDQETIDFAVKTGDTLTSLGNNQYRSLQDSGNLIRAYGNSQYAKIKVTFTVPIRSYPSGSTSIISQTNIWDGEGGTFMRRGLIQPTVFSIKIHNPIALYGDPSGSGDPAFGRNFATGSALLEGVVSDNSNRLSLATLRNFPTASASAGFIIASASANLGGNAGAGSHTIERNNGQFVTILGNSLTTTRVYDVESSTWTAGPALPAVAGAGSHSFLLPDGRFFVVLGGSTNRTAIFDPQSNVFFDGPRLFGNAGSGSNTFQRPDGLFVILNGGATTATNVLDPFLMSITQGPFTTGATPNVGGGALNIRRPDGRILIVLGNGNAIATGTNVYDPATNAFMAGPALVGGVVNTGGNAVQLSNGRVLLFKAAATTNTLDPIATTFAAGPAATANGAGSFIIPRADGKILKANGGNAATTNVYDPVAGTILTATSAPTLPCNVNTGGHVFQRQTGEYVVICGGGTASTAIIDAGWNLGGTYTTEQIQAPDLNGTTSLFWKNVGSGDITVKYRTASTRQLLGLASWKDIPRSGGYVESTPGDTWFQARFDLQGALMDLPGAKTRVWVGSDAGGAITYYRQVQAPILEHWKLFNVQDPTLLTLTSGGSNVFSFSSDGQAYTSDNGAWNSGGADLAERYSSKDELKAGEVVTLDRFNSQHTKRSTTSYDSNVMGVVSTQPGFVAGAFTENSYPIALVGRVPVKVSNENGEIKAGDYLTSASIPGYAMKATVAGRILGQAMEDVAADNLSECSKFGAGTLENTHCAVITVFVNLTSYNGQSVDVAVKDSGFTVQESDLPLIPGVDFTLDLDKRRQQELLSFLRIQKNNGQSIYTDTIAATQQVISPQIITDLLVAKKIKAESIEGLEILTNNIERLSDKVGSASALINFSEKLTSLSDGQQLLQQTMASISSKMSSIGKVNLANSEFASVNNFSAYGTTTLSQTTILSSLTIGSGNSMVINPTSIDVVGGELSFQSLKQGAINFLSGAIRFETDGKAYFTEDVTFAKNVAVAGVLSARTISTADLQLGQGVVTVISDNEVEASGAAGLVTLKKNNAFVTVKNPLVKESSFIFITPKTATRKSLYLLEQKESIDASPAFFKVGIDSESSEDIKFNYLIVN